MKAVNQVFKGTGLSVGAAAGANTLRVTIGEVRSPGGLEVEVRAAEVPPPTPNIIALLPPGGWRVNTPSEAYADETQARVIELVAPPKP